MAPPEPLPNPPGAASGPGIRSPAAIGSPVLDAQVGIVHWIVVAVGAVFHLFYDVMTILLFGMKAPSRPKGSGVRIEPRHGASPMNSQAAPATAPPPPTFAGATRRALLVTALFRAVGKILPSVVFLRVIMGLPLGVVGWILKRVRAVDGMVYRTVEIAIRPERHERKLACDREPFAANVIADARAPRVLHAEWVTTRERWVRGHRSDVVLYFHGGCYVALNSLAFRPVTRRLAKLGFAVLSVDYRRPPESPFPCAVHDALASYLWLVNDLGTDPAQILVMGDSAGGHIVASLMKALVELKGTVPLPRAACLLSPWLDLDPEAPSMSEFAGCDYLSILQNKHVDLVRQIAGPAMDRATFLKHAYVDVAHARIPVPVLLVSSPSEQLASGIERFFASQTPTATSKASVLHMQLLATPHDPLLIGVAICLTRPIDTVNVAYERLWDWWVGIRSGIGSSGKIRLVIAPDGRAQSTSVASSAAAS